jgi:hypothetical protein
MGDAQKEIGMKNLITCLTVCVLSGVTFADTWTVDDDGKADFNNIQAAVNEASNGDEIIVAPGTYTSTASEVVDMQGKEVWLHSSGGAEVTIIDGENARRGIFCLNSEAVIKGFTITNGFSTDGGGGMLNNNCSPVLENCIFTNNTAYTQAYGGGMLNSHAHPTLTNCAFIGNTSSQGGGMFNWEVSSPTLTNCTFTNNTATNYGGGGMGNNGSSNPVLTDCTFENNNSPHFSGGGIMSNYSSNPTLINCTIVGNTAPNGGGIYSFADSIPSLTDTIVCGNSPNQILPIGNWTDNGGNYIADFCDADGDGIYDHEDECPNDSENDADGDGICGDVDDCPYDSENDADGDGICGDVDAFPYDENEWADSDGDGMGDNEDLATLGACCVSSGCHQIAEYTCTGMGGTWAETGSCDDCVAPPETCAADIDSNGEVDIDDLLLLIAAWGACP